MSDYKNKALCYAERHGVIEYHVDGEQMIYYTSFPCEHMTYKAVINLNAMKEIRQAMSRYYKPFKYIGGKYPVNLGI